MASPTTLVRSFTGPPTLARSSTGRTLPNHEDLQPYNFAVAGHDGTLCDPDGELFIKPCTQQEIDFYETAFQDHVDFAELMPVYLGTLSLNDATDVTSLNEQLPVVADHMSQHMKEQAVRMAREAAAEAAAAAAPVPDGIAWNPNKNRKIATNKSVVLENAAYGFTRPNILDAKLGKRLWADDAPLEKRRRFDEISKATTNGSHGFRIAGMRVYKGSTDPSEWDAEGYKVYDKDYGRFTVTKDNVVQEMRKFIFNEQAGIDEDLGRAIAQAFVNDLRQVERVLSREESRMYSASLLFTFEGDGEALRAAIAAQSPLTGAKSTKEKKGEDGNGALLLASRVDSGIVLDDEGDIVLGPGKEHPTLGTIREHTIPGGLIEGDLKVHELTSGGQTEATSEDDEEDELSSLPRIYSLKLIDFAHASWVPGQGPDENNLFGVRSLVKIFEELAQ